MNIFVIAGAVLLILVLAGYIVSTRREIARLPPLEAKATSDKLKKGRRRNRSRRSLSVKESMNMRSSV